MKLITQQLLALLTLSYFPSSSFSQGFIWDKDHKCKIYTNNDINIRTFSYIGGKCKNEFLNGSANVQLFENGKLYYTVTGNFTDGYLNGKAEYKYSNGNSFNGTVENNMWTFGIYVVKGIYVYTGEFINTSFEGIGKLVFDNGDSFEGIFYKDNTTAQGTWIFKDGSRFVGIKHLSSGKDKQGLYYKTSDTKIPELKRMEDGSRQVFDIPDVKSTNITEKNKLNWSSLHNYIDKRYNASWEGVYDMQEKVFFPFLKDNCTVLNNKYGEPVIRFYVIIDCESGASQHISQFGHSHDIEIINEGKEKVEKIIATQTNAIEAINDPFFLKLSTKYKSVTLKSLNRLYLNQTGTSIKYGYFENPQIVEFDENGIYFYFQRDKRIRVESTQANDESYRKVVMDDAEEGVKILWKNIKYFEYSDYDIINNGYWLTINGSVINPNTDKKVADSHKVFVKYTYAKLLLYILNWIKNN